MRLIDADVLKEKTCDGGICSDCGEFWNGKNVQTNCSEIRWYFLNAIDDQPTVDAVPVSYIQQRIDRLRILAEYEFEANGGYVGRSDMAKFELEELIKYWKAEQEKQDG